MLKGLLTRLRAFARRVGSSINKDWRRLQRAHPLLRRGAARAAYIWREAKPALVALWSLARRLGRWVVRFLEFVVLSVRWAGRIAIVLVVLFLLFYLAIDTKPDVAYRYAAPQSAFKNLDTNGPVKPKIERDIKACNAQREKHSLVLTTTNNDESKASDSLPSDEAAAFTCMLQTHHVPVKDPRRWPDKGPRAPDGSLRYHLAFIEFAENGAPVEKGLDEERLEASQLDVLVKHLQEAVGKQNYVIVFVHGWRHDASIGDLNVQSLRLYAAYTASFLAQRCAAIQRYCDARVTAVYVGWRGARVHEGRVKRFFGEWLGESIATVLAAPSLFDRKAVSERIAPAVASALGQIHETLKANSKDADKKDKPWEARDRMLVVGHSLGGNILATAFRDKMIGEVLRMEPAKTRLSAPVGDLVVLLNPASEASNWTAIQRAVQSRILVNGNPAEQNAAASFYQAEQPPIYVSLTAAAAWPAGGIRLTDYIKLRDEFEAAARKKAANDKSGSSVKVDATNPTECQLERAIPDYRARPQYDQATHDLFPLFKGDLRPFAEALEESARLRCETKVSVFARSRAWIARRFVPLLRNMPFMNTDVHLTRTIGHLSPMRPPFGVYSDFNAQAKIPATTVGTTHEVIFNLASNAAPSYTAAGDLDESECAVVDHWLRAAQHEAGGVPWDSSYTLSSLEQLKGHVPPPNVTPIRPRKTIYPRECKKIGSKTMVWRTPMRAQPGHLEAQFRLGHVATGMRPIVNGRDPFWNVRAFDTALQGHSGYGSYPLMCTLQQLVMDNIAGEPKAKFPPAEFCSATAATGSTTPAP